MNAGSGFSTGNVFKRASVLNRFYTLLSNAKFLLGYYFLPEGFLRDSALTTAGQVASRPESFWQEFGLTLLFKLGWQMGLVIVLILNQVKGLPTAYLIPISLATVSGLIAGSHSFVGSDLNQYSVRDGLALTHSIGGLEMLGYILVIAATVPFGIYQYRNWWRVAVERRIQAAQGDEYPRHSPDPLGVADVDCWRKADHHPRISRNFSGIWNVVRSEI